MEPEFIGGEDADRYRDALRALETASGRVVARVEITWMRAADDDPKRLGSAHLNVVASSREEERALVEIAVVILKGGSQYNVEPEQAGGGEQTTDTATEDD